MESQTAKPILVVEDEELTLRLFTAILNAGGFAVLPAATAGQAVEICRERAGPLAVAVIDRHLPDGAGTRLARELQRNCPDLRIVFVSGLPLEQWDVRDGEALAGMPVDAYTVLLKPFLPSALLEKVRQLLWLPRSRTVLLAQRDPLLRFLIGRVLRNHGYKVLEAISADDARRISVQSTEPISVLVDGVSRARDTRLESAIKARHPETAVLFTPKAAPGIQIPYNTIPQPLLEPEEVLARIRRLLEGRVAC